MDPGKFPLSPKPLPRCYELFIPLAVPSVRALEGTELNFQTTKESRATLKTQDTFSRPTYEPPIAPAAAGRSGAAPRRAVRPSGRALSCPQPCLLTPLTNPSHSAC